MVAIVQSETEIANRALQICGEYSISNLWTDTTRAGKEIQNCFHMLRREQLRRHIWRFSIRSIALRPLFIPQLQIVTGATSQSSVGTTMLATFGTWSGVTTYAANDIVTASDTLIYQAIVANTNVDPSAHNPNTWRRYYGADAIQEFVTTWSNTTTYQTNMHTVGSNGTVYISIANANINFNPVSDGGVHWVPTTDGVIATSGSGVLPYIAFVGDMVYVGNNVYVSLTNNNSSTPPGSQWLKLTTQPTLTQFNFSYPIGIGPQSGLTSQTQNIYRLPVGYIREAPQSPKAGSQPWLGAPATLPYDDWQYEGNYLLSFNYSAPVIYRFAADIDSVLDMDPMFTEGLACRIAVAIAEPLTQSATKVKAAADTFNLFMKEARLVDSIEEGPIEAPTSKYLQVRY
jgi:hypothetical protein